MLIEAAAGGLFPASFRPSEDHDHGPQVEDLRDGERSSLLPGTDLQRLDSFH
jgi:hypothetical protein